jgi:hypothetical protein
MADWPVIEEFKQVVNVDLEADNWTTTLDRILAASIARVKLDVGSWDELVDEPDDALAQAALRMGELIAERPAASTEGTDDPTYWRLLYGHRKRFAVS